MNTSITEQTIEGYFNMIRNWDDKAKQKLLNRIKASMGNCSFTDLEPNALLADLICEPQIELLLTETRKN